MTEYGNCGGCQWLQPAHLTGNERAGLAWCTLPGLKHIVHTNGACNQKRYGTRKAGGEAKAREKSSVHNVGAQVSIPSPPARKTPPKTPQHTIRRGKKGIYELKSQNRPAIRLTDQEAKNKFHAWAQGKIKEWKKEEE